MSNEGKYYFAFRKNHKLHGHWVEIFTYSEKEAMDTFYVLYENWQWPLNKNALKYHTKGCYRQVHLPLPENIKIDSEDPFFSEPKRDQFIWAMIGANKTGKSSFWPSNHIQTWGRANRATQMKPIMILDDYSQLMPGKNMSIHEKINNNVLKSGLKKYTKDFKITYGTR